MKRNFFLVLTVLALIAVSVSSFAQDLALPAKGTIVAPPSTLVGIGGVHTSAYVFIPEGGVQGAIPNGETPASIACIYGVTPPTPGCPKNGTVVPTGGSKAIAVIVDGRYGLMQRDLNTFSDQFGLPRTTVTEICSPGPPPCPHNEGSGWDLVTAAALEWAHAMAPNAQLILSEFTNDVLLDGELQAAGAAVAAAGGGEVINTWQIFLNEWCRPGNCETDFDSLFQKDGVVFFAATGINKGQLVPAYPSVSPNVVSAGGTSIVRDSNGNFTGEEDCWSGSGGGISLYEPLPQYQLIIGNITGPKRGTPDLAAVADPNTGVDVYAEWCGGWCVVGGNGNAATLLAGIVNAAGNFYHSSPQQLSKEYMEYRNPGIYHQYFYDVTNGNNGSQAKLGWDQCTGLGSPRKLAGF